jgi:hypothetical protein
MAGAAVEVEVAVAVAVDVEEVVVVADVVSFLCPLHLCQYPRDDILLFLLISNLGG